MARGEIEFTQIDSSTGAPGTWASVNGGSNTGKLPAGRALPGGAVYNGRLYITGGVSGGTDQTTVYYVQPSVTTGDITVAWSSGTVLTSARREHATVAVGGYLYVMGGISSTTYLNLVQYAEISEADGTIGAWSNSRDLPSKVRHIEAIAANGYIYVFAGRTATSTCVNDTFVSSVSSNGTVGDWQKSVNEFSTARYGMAAAYYNGYIYLTGGNDCTNIISAAGEGVKISGQQSQAIKTVYSRYMDFGGDATPRQITINGTHMPIDSTDIDSWRLRYISSTAGTNSWGASSFIQPIVFNNFTTSLSAVNSSNVNQGVSQWWTLFYEIDMAQSFTFTDDTYPTITDYTFYYSPASSKRLRNGRDFRDETKQNLDTRF